MGLRGPAPKPSALKRREGTYRRDRAPAHEPRPAVAAPSRPKGVSGDADARACWDNLVPLLEELQLLSRIDGPALEGLCRSYAVAVKADRQLKKGVVIKTPWGLQQNPAVSISRLAWAEVRKFASEFGLTPAARSRVSVKPAPTEKDTAEDFLFGHSGRVVGTIGA